MVAGGLDEPGLPALAVPEVIVTLGSRGCIVCAGDGPAEHIATFPVAGDATGAGDAFAAAYLSARDGGSAPAAAARLASVLVADLIAGRTA